MYFTNKFGLDKVTHIAVGGWICAIVLMLFMLSLWYDDAGNCRLGYVDIILYFAFGTYFVLLLSIFKELCVVKELDVKDVVVK